MEVSENEAPSIYKILKGTIPGGILINLICTPSDVIKNYWYYNKTLSNNRTKLSTIDVIKHIHRNNGSLSFWIGILDVLI
ncbi:hypothetical protein BEWA_007610 [Theileria equi strain WA]|uniref:Uncharacterized protein n=1 Tax=Theileria equi strain WA TaxID=1537102 RepID=L0B0H3_THEEQ|nr:hypothetical protein BEWA_007610 [Theileria equi strain WA]AFZ81352.1 hypothetical protein BEWA_007610 [Theileria equi strain WA]|eukprot:XP_004831018.1 hypothetical protein BEWA_007610 [Theileria equi strain WA]